MPTYRFQVVRRTRTVKLKCACGSRFQRTLAAEQTINPFNKNADGVPKTYAEIWPEVGRKVADMQPDTRCRKCGQTAEVVNDGMTRLRGEGRIAGEAWVRSTS
jgi:hypothetical protein